MFRMLGHNVARFWPLWLGGWLVLLMAIRLTAPPWHDVAQDKEFGLLPADAPSRRSEAIFAKAFPGEPAGSNAVLVFTRAESKPGDLERDKKFIEDVIEPGLRRIAAEEGGLAGETVPTDQPLFDNAPAKPVKRSIIFQIHTPNAPGSGGLLISEDNKELLVVVDLTTELLSPANWPTLAKIENLVATAEHAGKVPAGLAISLTGSALIGRDHLRAERDSARSTERFTIVFAIVLLLLIYRSPVLALIPLVTVYLTVQVALGVLAMLAQAGVIALFQGVQIYITILTYGAGIDYCLFLTARYREELAAGADVREAVARAVGSTGAALTASAATVIGGIGMMMFADYGKFRQAGFAIPLSLLLVLGASLTFSPALVRLAGRWALWPRGLRPSEEAANGLGDRHPNDTGFWRWRTLGQALLRRPGTIWLTTVALMVPFAIAVVALDNEVTYDPLTNLPADAPSLAGTRALQEHFPPGIMGPITVVLVQPHADFRSDAGREAVSQLTAALHARQGELGLYDIRSFTAPLGLRAPGQHAMAEIKSRPEAAKAARQAAEDRYLSDLGERVPTATRIDLVLEQDPFSNKGLSVFEKIATDFPNALPAELQPGVQLYFLGPTPSIHDLRTIMEGDRFRIQYLVLASVFLILLLLLRKLIVSLYLILSVLFSYYVALGVTVTVIWLLNPHDTVRIDFKVVIFLFTILIAVGEDYNIFLMTRIHEEQRRYDAIRGIPEALARTGPIISSCGIIMAGTFASLMTGSLLEMKQLGFALAFGVLLDTFIVLPILVPAFLLMLETGMAKGGTSTVGSSRSGMAQDRVAVDGR